MKVKDEVQLPPPKKAQVKTPYSGLGIKTRSGSLQVDAMNECLQDEIAVKRHDSVAGKRKSPISK